MILKEVNYLFENYGERNLILKLLIYKINSLFIKILYFTGELDHALKLSKPKYIFASKTSSSTLLKVKKNNKFIEEIIVFDDEKVPGTINYSDFLAKFKSPALKIFTPAIVPLKEQVAFILCSSGTTGQPKGVQLTYNNILTCIGIMS